MAEKTTHDIETSLTLSYRQNAWGIERIVLDSISNHLPADSNGTKTSVKLKQGGNYLCLKEADSSKPVDEIVLEDNGSGYDAGLLSVLFSAKTGDALSVGQFGEGLKMAAAAALRNSVNMEYRSKNWRAVPFVKQETIGGREIERLCFRVVENGDSLEGSRTVFTSPSEELVKEVLRIPENVLAFNERYRELFNDGNIPDSPLKKFLSLYADVDFSSLLEENRYIGGSFPQPECRHEPNIRYKSRIIDLGAEKKALFVKGIKVQNLDSIFSYDLGIENLSPDRKFADRAVMLEKIESLLKDCTSMDVIEEILRKARDEPHGDYEEFHALGRPRKDEMDFGHGIHLMKDPRLDNSLYKKNLYSFGGQESLWVRAFKNVFWETAVLDSVDTGINEDAKLMGFKPIRLHYGVANYLACIGVERAQDIKGEQEYKWVGSNELTEAEKEKLSLCERLCKDIPGTGQMPEVRVYSGLFMASGREIESSLGVQIREENGRKYIGIKRALLGMPDEEVAETYIHELGHYVTGHPDYSRKFTDFFVHTIAQWALGKKKPGEQ